MCVCEIQVLMVKDLNLHEIACMIKSLASFVNSPLCLQCSNATI